MRTLITVSGRRKVLPETWESDREVVGLDADGRIVVDWFGAREKPYNSHWSQRPFIFGLTLCCNASDKGMEDGVGCRGCYGLEGELAVARDGRKVIADAGNTMFMAPDGTFPGLDPIDHIEED